MGYGPLVHFKGPSSFWARIISDSFIHVITCSCLCFITSRRTRTRTITGYWDKYLENVFGTAVLLTLRSRKKHQKEKYLDALHRNLGNYIEHGISENIH